MCAREACASLSRVTTANKITLVRIAMIPVFVALAIYYGESVQRGAPLEWQRFAAILVFLLAAVSDGLDGYVARRYNQRSRLGVILDPIADKGLLLSGIITLSITNFGRCRYSALFHRQQNAAETKLDGQGGDCLSDVRDRVGDVAAAIFAAVVRRDRGGNLHPHFGCDLCHRRYPPTTGRRSRPRHALTRSGVME
ncbi:MAG: hypothetical protein DMF23_06555 [Verrucomicrobia bacterium]|nr:MAG: hypothetical protein DMF23_06555 [Verrucomicrobiota bacterium]